MGICIGFYDYISLWPQKVSRPKLNNGTFKMACCVLRFSLLFQHQDIYRVHLAHLLGGMHSGDSQTLQQTEAAQDSFL